MSKNIIIFIFFIPLLLFARVFTNSAGTLDINNKCNYLSNSDFYEEKYQKENWYLSTTYFNIIDKSRGEIGYSLIKKTSVSEKFDLYANINGSFFPSLNLYTSLKNSIDLNFNNKYLMGLQYNYLYGSSEIGFNLGCLKNNFLNFPFNIYINSSIFFHNGYNESNNTFSHVYYKLDYEYGLYFEYFYLYYRGYYNFNFIDYIENSLLRNYFSLKVKLPYLIRLNKQWYLNIFIGNSFDVNLNNESDKYRKIEKHIIKGISITF